MSRFLTALASVWIKRLRGSTASPINMSKVRPASAAASRWIGRLSWIKLPDLGQVRLVKMTWRSEPQS